MALRPCLATGLPFSQRTRMRPREPIITKADEFAMNLEGLMQPCLKRFETFLLARSELPRTLYRRSSHCPTAPVLRASPSKKGHNTARSYYQSLMYAELRISDTLHKNPCRTGPGLCRTSENGGQTNFAEFFFCELRCNARCNRPHKYPLVVNIWP